MAKQQLGNGGRSLQHLLRYSTTVVVQSSCVKAPGFTTPLAYECKAPHLAAVQGLAHAIDTADPCAPEVNQSVRADGTHGEQRDV